MQKKTKLKLLILIPICIVVLFAMIIRIGPDKIMVEIAKADPAWIAAAFIIALTSLFVRLIRWYYLMGINKFKEVSVIYLIGQAMNSVAPAGTGEIMRVYTAKKQLRISGGLTLAACAIERIYDITLLLSMSIYCLILLTNTSTPVFQILIPVALLSFGYLILIRPNVLDKIAYFLESVFEREESYFNILAFKLSRWLKSFKKALVKYKTRKSIHVVGFSLTIVIWVLDGFSLFLLFKSMDTHVSLYLLISTISLAGIIGTFSFLPGGLGARELSFTVILGFFGVLEEVSASVILISRSISYLMLGTGFLISLTFISKLRIKK